MKKRAINEGMFREVQGAIRTEPIRFAMNFWGNVGDVLAPCGSTACIAGWIVTIDLRKRFAKKWKGLSEPQRWKQAVRSVERSSEASHDGRVVLRKAAKLAGISEEQAEALFFSEHWPEEFRREQDRLEAQL